MKKFEESLLIQVMIDGNSEIALANAISLSDMELPPGQGWAKRNPLDSHDQETAVLLSTSRALAQLSKQYYKASLRRQSEVSHLANLKSGKVKFVGGTLHPALVAKATSVPSKAPRKRSAPLKGSKPKSVKIKV